MESIIRNYAPGWDSMFLTSDPSPSSPTQPQHDPKRLKTIGPWLKRCVEWGVKLRKKVVSSGCSVLPHAEFLSAMLSREYPRDIAQELCLSHLYGTVSHHSNATLRLLEDSFGGVTLILFRSVIEAYAKCNYISQNIDNRPSISHDFLACDILGARYRGLNLERRKTKKPDSLSDALKERFPSFPHHLCWVDIDSDRFKSIHHLLAKTDKKYPVLYHFCNPEVHGNYIGHPRYAFLQQGTPHRIFPLVFINKNESLEDHSKELEIDYCVTEVIVNMLTLAPHFLNPSGSLAQNAKSLSARGNRILVKLKER